MKPGDLRRFHDDGFPTNDKQLNGAVFMIVEMHPSVSRLNVGWNCRILENISELVDETR